MPSLLRLLPAAVAAVLPAAACRAQRSDSARADSIRADSARRARADSLMRRERDRIRSEPRAPAERPDSPPPAPPPAARRGARLGWRAGIGVAGATPFLEDGNGVTVRPGVAPVAQAALVWDVAPATAVSVGFRGAAVPVRLRGDGRSWSGGTAAVVDATAAVERAFAGGRFAAHAGGGLLMLRGPEDVAPFRFANESPVRWAAELGGAARFGAERPLYATIAAQTHPLGAEVVADPSERGYVTRVILGVRYGR